MCDSKAVINSITLLEMLVFHFLTSSVRRTHFTVLVMPEVREDKGDPSTGETSPKNSSSDEEQPGIEFQEIVPSATVSGEIRQPPPDDASNLSFEEAMQRKKFPLQRSWDSVSSGSLQPEEPALDDTPDYSFKNSKLGLRRGSSSKSPEEETDAARLGDSMTELSARSEPSGHCDKNDQKENESPVTRVEKYSKVVGELASRIESSYSCVKSPLSEQNTLASLEDGKESDSATEVTSSASFQPDYPSPDSTEHSFSNAKVVLRRRSSTSISPEKKTGETRVEDSMIELAATPEPSGCCDENVQKSESPVTKVIEKCTKAAGAVASEIKSSLTSCFRPPLSEQSSSASLADVSENESVSAMEVVSPGSLQQDDPWSDSTEYSFSNTKLELQRASSTSPENETDDARVVDSTTEMSSKPEPSDYCDKTKEDKDESSLTKVAEKCSEAFGGLASGITSSLISCTRPPLSEQNSSASLADMRENELDSTMEVDSSRIQPDDSVSDSIKSENAKSAFQRDSEFQEEKTDAAAVEDSINELSGSPGSSTYCGKGEKNESLLEKMVEKCSKVAEGIKSLASGTKAPPLSEQQSSSSLADVSENESDSSTEVARKYRKLLNQRKECIPQSVPGSEEQTRTRRKRFRRQSNVEEGVEMETIAIDSASLPEKPETTTHETQTDTAKEIFYRNLCLLSDSDFSTSKETENDDTEDTTE